MTNGNVIIDETGLDKPLGPEFRAKRPGLRAQLCVWAWCGLVAGLLEVGTIVLRKALVDPNQLYGMSRHFGWLIPVANLGVFLTVGLLGWIACRAWPRRGRWLCVRIACALTLLPMFLVALPRIYGAAGLVMMFGIAVRLVPFLERNRPGLQRLLQVGFPLAVAVLLILAVAPWAGDWIKQSRASAQPLPSPGSPNVLLIVLDTVAASHLSLHGYDRATSTTLLELAERGIRFDSARAAASWTLPSHATIFTGRWLHELSVGWLNPLDATCPTLAEYLGANGYATAGFVANTTYCASDSGLGRGFVHYRDYIFPELTAFRSAILIKRVLAGLQAFEQFVQDRLELTRLQLYLDSFCGLFVSDRKGADVVNREFLNWLSGRTQPQRPFFAFLNYADAHTPYLIQPARMHRFQVEPMDNRQRTLIEHWADLDKNRVTARDLAIVVDAYDDCIADLDEQLGMLLDELGRRGTLRETWLVITSDHGESFGEHKGVFCHGTSLYQTELHVPLLIVPPGDTTTKQIIKESVSLRDLAATIVDVLGMKTGSRLPGSSLARLWERRSDPDLAADPVLAEVVPGDVRDRDSYGLPRKTWPLGALSDGEWSYIHRAGDDREELFDLRQDAKEQRSLDGNPAAQPILERMRSALDRLTAGPLLPQRFNR